MSKITANMSVPEILEKYPQTEPVFEKYGLNPHYKALQYEDLSASVVVNRIQLDTLLEELNEVAK